MNKRFAAAAAAAVLAALLAGCDSMPRMPWESAAPAKVDNGVYVGANGMTLYTFDRDATGSGKSACNGQCATAWPPLMAAAGASNSGEWTVITRDDGSKQWAYKGKPLYYWQRDAKPGDRTGDGFNNAWRLARP